MEKEDCLNCRTHFKEGQKLPLQGISVELKNYNLPLKDQKHKWILLKTICSFLNSKGGTIYIGAEDSTGEIKGITIQRKEQDQFKLFIESLVSKIQPPVDLSDKQEIIVQFLPVLLKDKFSGKYLVKIAVSQGDSSKLYCFTQRITMELADKKTDQYEIVYSYKRQNMGNVRELKGLQVVTEAANKATKPAQTHKTFHQDCNPEPPNMSVQIVRIGFSGIGSKQIRALLEKWFDHYLQELMILEFTIDFDSQNDMVVIDLQGKVEYEKVINFIDMHLEELNKNVNECVFVKADVFLDCMLYKNERAIAKVQVKQQKNINKYQQQKFQRKKRSQMEPKTEQTQFKAPKVKQSVENSQKKQQKNEKNEKSEKQNKITKPTENKGVQNGDKLIQSKKQRTKKYLCLTLTHISPQKKADLVNFLDNNIYDCFKKINSQYENTVEVFFETEQNLEFYLHCLQREELDKYGFKEEIRLGRNEGVLSINNYEKNKWKDLRKYLQMTMGKDLEGIQPLRKGNKYSLLLTMSSKPLACTWLDKLLHDKSLKNYSIPGANKGSAAKMKIFLQLSQYEIEYQQQRI